MNSNIFIDIDDTLADSQTHILSYVNAHSRTPYQYDDLSRSFREGDVVEYETLAKEFLATPELVATIQPYQDAVDGMRLLHEAGYKLHVVSSRKEPLHQITIDWLIKHGLIDYVEQIHPRSKTTPGHLFKRRIAEAVRPLAAFDDTYDVGLELAEAGVKVFLINKPWNRDEPLVAGMERVATFRAGVDHLIGSVSTN